MPPFGPALWSDTLGHVYCGAEIVFHLASLAHVEQSHSNDETHERLTLEGTRSLLAATETGGSFVALPEQARPFGGVAKKISADCKFN